MKNVRSSKAYFNENRYDELNQQYFFRVPTDFSIISKLKRMIFFILFPSPTFPDKITVDVVSTLVLVTFDMLSYKMRTNFASVKSQKTLSIPQWLNEESLAINVSFSQVLPDVLLEIVPSKNIR